ncbi:hypothetical protein CHS0354_036781 [Potamilus streckersoni]|uniref:Zinc finger PHD-type domain-containing protein n=1 Tax=Potamilus streckersoni TaxID=2493646 RepID=A0AAE0S630_9BIVA|nr:hypothetical protein CHS0354_036781 [Potamilus streckersoni]
MQHPCICCTKEVTTRQQAVECDCCHRWQHRTCGTEISLKVYQEALKLVRLTFVCSKCVRPVGHMTSVAVNASYNEEPPALELRVIPIAESTQMDADPFLDHLSR